MAIEDVSAEEIENELLTWMVARNDRPLTEEGWFTAGKMADLAHISYDRANSLLNKGVEDGEIEYKRFSSGKYYRLKKKG